MTEMRHLLSACPIGGEWSGSLREGSSLVRSERRAVRRVDPSAGFCRSSSASRPYTSRRSFCRPRPVHCARASAPPRTEARLTSQEPLSTRQRDLLLCSCSGGHERGSATVRTGGNGSGSLSSDGVRASVWHSGHHLGAADTHMSVAKLNERPVGAPLTPRRDHSVRNFLSHVVETFTTGAPFPSFVHTVANNTTKMRIPLEILNNVRPRRNELPTKRTQLHITDFCDRYDPSRSSHSCLSGLVSVIQIGQLVSVRLNIQTRSATDLHRRSRRRSFRADAALPLILSRRVTLALLLHLPHLRMHHTAVRAFRRSMTTPNHLTFAKSNFSLSGVLLARSPTP